LFIQTTSKISYHLKERLQINYFYLDTVLFYEFIVNFDLSYYILQLMSTLFICFPTARWGLVP